MCANETDRGTLIVTGGSRGIGAAVSRLAAAQGYAVVVNFVADEKTAGSLVEDIRARGGRATAVRRLSLKHGGRGGAIVNISSRAADLGSPGEWVHYAASKGAVNTFTIGLASEVAGEGIRVNAVSPGLIETDIHAAAGDPGRIARLAGRIPMGRAGTAEEAAEAVIWLLSPSASYVTGSILTVSGGR